MAITTSYTWNITELRNDTSDKFITHAAFSITGVANLMVLLSVQFVIHVVLLLVLIQRELEVKNHFLM